MQRIPRLALPFVAAMLLSSAASATPTDISNGAPYQADVVTIMGNGPTSVNVPITNVPAGKRLVIRAVNGIVYGPLGEKYRVILLTSVDGAAQWHPMQVSGESFADPEAQANATIFSRETYVNAKPDEQGRIVRVSFVRSYPGGYAHPTFVRITLSGYVIDDVLPRPTDVTDPLKDPAAP